MLRLRIVVAILMLIGMPIALRAQETMPPLPDEIEAFEERESSYPETWSEELQHVPNSNAHDEIGPNPAYGYETGLDHMLGAIDVPDSDRWLWLPKPKWFGLRHSSTHGRNVGRGEPLVGTSWRNRPFYIGAELGTMWFTRSLDENVSRDIDMFGGIIAGWDFDHYWGNEFHFDWSTPEFKNRLAPPDASQTGAIFEWNYNLLYYPWGDAKLRPYWRAGVGTTGFEVPLDDGSREDETMWTFPLGMGIKYPIRRWFDVRAEVADHISVDSDYPTQHNVTLTFGFECRYGAHPPSYWPWNPSRHIW